MPGNLAYGFYSDPYYRFLLGRLNMEPGDDLKIYPYAPGVEEFRLENDPGDEQTHALLQNHYNESGYIELISGEAGSTNLVMFYNDGGVKIEAIPVTVSDFN